MKIHIPDTDLTVESRKIEVIQITGPSLQEALDYCAKHSLRIGPVRPQDYTRPDGTMGIIFSVEASRDVQLVEV